MQINKPTKENIRTMRISALVDTYPYIAEMLQYEWGFHCVTCIISGFETLEQGAGVHEIEGEDFEMMLDMIIQYINIQEAEKQIYNENNRRDIDIKKHN